MLHDADDHKEIPLDAKPTEEGRRNPFVFVVGCPRSGTTLLQRMLTSHPMLAVANDTHFIPRCLEKVAPQSIPGAISGEAVPLTEELVVGVRHYHRFAALGLGAGQVEEAAAESATYRDFVSALYTRFAALSGKALAGEKTPDYVRSLPLLHGLFPEVRTVHIVRDGRDVALSVLEWANEKKGPGKLELWKDRPLAVAALWWRWQVKAGRESGAILGPGSYMEVRYEDLVRAPEGQLRRISDFLGLPFAPEMLTYYEGKVKSNTRLSAKNAWLPPTAGLRDWKTQMAAEDMELFEALAGDLMDELGLERTIRTPSSETAEIAASCRSWWEAWLARRAAKRQRRVRGRRAARRADARRETK